MSISKIEIFKKSGFTVICKKVAVGGMPTTARSLSLSRASRRRFGVIRFFVVGGAIFLQTLHHYYRLLKRYRNYCRPYSFQILYCLPGIASKQNLYWM